MAETEEILEKANHYVEMTEGFMTDAEFREDHEDKLIRYLQAMCHALLAISAQNQVVIDLLQKREGYGALSGD